MKRMQGVMGPSPLAVYVAHWLHYGVLLPLGEEADPDFVDRALAFGRLVREWRRDAPPLDAPARMLLRPRAERFLRGERQHPAWTARPPWRPGACL